MSLDVAGVEKLREMALAAVGKDHEPSAFGVLGGELVAALCAGWLENELRDPYSDCCCGECL